MQEPKGLRFTPKQFERWQARVKASEQKRVTLEKAWKDNVAAMEGHPLKGDVLDDTIALNKDFPRTKAKVSQLLFRIPELVLRARQEAFKAAAPVFSAALNFILNHVCKAHFAVDEVLTDTVNASGFGVVKVGYEAATQEVTLADGAKVLVPIYEEYYVRRVSPNKFLWPAEFTGSDWDDADWLGFEFERPLNSETRKAYGLPDSFSGTKKKIEGLSESEDASTRPGTDEEVIRGREIWYWASRFDSSAKHPKEMRRLVLVEGLDKEAKHETSPFQKLVNGKLTGLLRFPLRPLTLTYISDKSVPPSDSQVARPLVLELIESRSQMIRQRRRSLPIRWYDVNMVDDDDVLERLKNGNIQDFIPTNGPGERAVGEISRANYPRESFEFKKIAEEDLDECWAMGANQMGTETSGETTAEEVRTMQSNATVRLDYERTKALRWFVGVAESIGSLMQLFADNEDYVEIIGPDGARVLQAWDKTKISGEYIFEAKPDTSVRVDISADRRQKVQLYQMVANEPFVNRQKLVEALFTAYALDPTQLMQQPPERKPDPANVSYRFSGEDLLNPLALAVMMKSGIAVSPQDLQAAVTIIQAVIAAQAGTLQMTTAQPGAPPTQPEHGGPAEQVAPLSKHQLDEGSAA